jgi:hypothetical protein
MLTARDRIQDCIEGLTAALTTASSSPSRPRSEAPACRERRISGPSDSRLRFGREVDLVARAAFVSGEQVDLTVAMVDPRGAAPRAGRIVTKGDPEKLVRSTPRSPATHSGACVACGASSVAT